MSSYKRPRKDFEADLQKQESPYVVYGTPLPPLDENARDDGSFVPVWQQEVRDERGRKRLHGAFTGGWSAGYFNTVGSKEGWTPSTFKSSRSDRAKDRKDGHQRLEDYMDDEDLAEAEQSKTLQTAGGFAGLGGTEHDSVRQTGLLDIFRPVEATMGVRLLQKMGWKQGQGIGPKIRRTAREDLSKSSRDDAPDTHLFAPDNTEMISFTKKSDHKGLGYGGEASLSRSVVNTRQPSDEDEEGSFPAKSQDDRSTQQKARGGFGMGVLNDTGSDDEDPYTMGPKISYNRVIGGDKKKSKKAAAAKPTLGTSNPLLSRKPVFIPTKAKDSTSGFRKCHDGRLPLDGFVLAVRPAALQKVYAAPKVPEGWRSKFSSTETNAAASAEYQSTTDAAKASSMDPQARANMLGEQQLPGKSVFDYISSVTRDRLAAASGRENLPAAGNESAPDGFRKSEAEKAKDLRSMMPDLDRDTAMQALNHRSMPYAEDESKRRRYRQFLELKAGTRTNLPERGKDEKNNIVNADEFIKEMREFVHAAKVFRPMSGMMATRFTSSTSSVLPPDPSDPSSLLSKAAPKPTDPAEEAAKLGMYGPMTRMVLDFYPTRLVCKRFNVRPPAHVTVDPGSADGTPSGTTAASAAEPVSKRDLDRMMQDAALSRINFASGTSFVSGSAEEGSTETNEQGRTDLAAEIRTDIDLRATGPAKVDVERNVALEQERPGEELFKAIFGSDDEDE